MPSKTRWVGIDGEGIGRKPHRYTLLAYSDAEGGSKYIEDPQGLATRDALDFLLATPARARLAGYFLGYDWTMILRDLPDASIYRLFRPEMRVKSEGGGFESVWWGEYRLHYLAGMMRIARGKGKEKRTRTIWDVGKFFQAPFVEALRKWGIPADVQAIEDMKALRSTFTPEQWERIRGYCLSECQALARLVTSLEASLETAGLKPKSWHGPGSVAKRYLADWDIDKRRGEQPPEVLQAADRAFFGGRFEQATIGRVESVWGADIASAYPFQMYHLPCLEHGRWQQVTRERDLPALDAPNETAIVRYRLDDIGPSEHWGPLPCRMSNGTILFPRGGSSGWVYLSEYLAAKEGWGGVRWGGKAWVLRSNCDCHVFEGILDLYRARVRVGKGTKGIAYKLALNSGYGSIAQRIGFPKFSNVVWAGLITSGCRAQLLRLMTRHLDRNAVIALATDGLFTREKPNPPPDPLPGESLGSWEVTDEPETMIFVRPGIYWSEGGRSEGQSARHRPKKSSRANIRHSPRDSTSLANCRSRNVHGVRWR